MAVSPDIKVITDILWKGALLFAVIDIPFVYMLSRRTSAAAFRDLKWTLIITTGVFFCLLFGTLMSGIFWQSVYHYFFPEWARWLIIPIYGLLFAVAGFSFWWLATHLLGNPVVNWCILGGLWGMVTHTWAMLRGLLDKPPMLQGAAPVAVLAVAAVEFIFYWCVVLSIASLLCGGRPTPYATE